MIETSRAKLSEGLTQHLLCLDKIQATGIAREARKLEVERVQELLKQVEGV